MTNPYPPSEPRRLTRDPSNKLIGGVCSGIAKYLNMDVNLVRILTVLISLFTGIPIVLYIVALFVMPEERQPPPPPHLGGPDPMHYQAPGYDAAAQPYPPYRQPDAQRPPDEVWGSAGAPWEQQPASPPPPAAPAPSPQTWPERPTEAPQPESVAQTGTANPEAGKASTWESAPADPEPSDKDEGTSGEQRQG